MTTNGKTLFIEAKENEVIKTKDIKAAEMNEENQRDSENQRDRFSFWQSCPDYNDALNQRQTLEFRDRLKSNLSD